MNRQARIMGDQLSEMRSSSIQTDRTIAELSRQANSSESQLRELDESNGINRKAMFATVYSQSAAVSSTQALFSPDLRETGGIKAAQIGINLVNTGSTFTQTALIQINFWDPIDPIPLGYDFHNLKNNASQIFRATFAPHSIHPVISEPIPVEKLGEIQVGTRHYYIYGEIDYVDLFDNPHITKFCTEIQHIMGDLTNGRQGEFALGPRACDEHNCADKGCEG